MSTQTEILLCAVDTPTEVLNIIFNILMKLRRIVKNTEFKHKFASFGKENGQLNSPGGIAVFHDGRIVIADSVNNRIQIFSPNGEFLSTFGSAGNKHGEFYGPEGVAIDNEERIIVSDLCNYRLQVFSQNFKFLFT